jgi:putative transposase
VLRVHREKPEGVWRKVSVSLVQRLSKRLLRLGKKRRILRAREDRKLARQIAMIYRESRERYGSPRVHQKLKANGILVGRKRVERLMRANGLKGRVVKVTRWQPGLRRFHAQGENLRLKRPETQQVNEVWTADVTYLRAQGKWMYLAAIMDLHSRRIVGWSLSRTRTTDLTLTALRYAIRDRKPTSPVLFHTDRGIEYTGSRYQRQLKKHGLVPSLNRAGHCTDNAHMESFFHSMKAELIRGRTYATEKELRIALRSYINGFYNTTRLHSGIGYQSPITYEQGLN